VLHVPRFVILGLHNLPFQDRRRLVVPEINLILWVTGGFDNRLDRRIYNLSTVHLHADADFVPDFVLLIGHEVRLAHRVEVSILSSSTSM
jgi:hypothetical protein